MQNNNKAAIPSTSGKVGLSQISDISVQDFSNVTSLPTVPTRYWQNIDKHQFDMLWHPKHKADRLFVLFSGDAMRKKFGLPVFQRWSWAPHFPGHCVYFSDPSLYFHDQLSLAWYSGNASYDPLPIIADIVASIADKIGVSPDRIWTYGSSGGGFAALRALEFLPGAGAVCVNPQTNIAEYERKSVDFYFKHCFEGRSRKKALEDFPDRVNLQSSQERFARRKIIYVQNYSDVHHYEIHYKAFCRMMRAVPLVKTSSAIDFMRHTDYFYSILFDHKKGHAKAETPEAFAASMETISLLDGDDVKLSKSRKFISE